MLGINTIRVQRNRLKSHLMDNPSLKAHLRAAVPSAYENVRIEAASETDQDEAVFPEVGTSSPDQVLAPDVWPDKAQA